MRQAVRPLCRRNPSIDPAPRRVSLRSLPSVPAMTFNPAPLLSVRDISVTFQIPRGLFRGTDQLRAVDGVSFDLFPGETLGIVGESGCGKSTLGRAVLKLIEPTGGTVAWLGQDLADLPERRMRSHRKDMQVIFQDPL